MKFNTFFRVAGKVEAEAEKRARLADLAGYDMSGLSVYLLKQL